MGYQKGYQKSLGNNIIEYALPLAFLITAGIVIALTTNIPNAIAQFFSNSNNGLIASGGVQVNSLGTPVSGGTPITPPSCMTARGACITRNDPGKEQVDTTGGNGGGVPSTIEDIQEMLPDDNFFSNWIQQLANAGWAIGDSGAEVIDIDMSDISSIVELFQQINGQNNYFQSILENFTDIGSIDINQLLGYMDTIKEFGEAGVSCPGGCNAIEQIAIDLMVSMQEQPELTASLQQQLDEIISSIEYFQDNEFSDTILQIIQDSASEVIAQANQYSIFQTAVVPTQTDSQLQTGNLMIEITDLVTGEVQQITDPEMVAYFIQQAEAAGTEVDPITGAIVSTNIATGSSAIVNQASDNICATSNTCAA